jgi:hypothetical protein
MTGNMPYPTPSGAPGSADRQSSYLTMLEAGKATPGKPYAAGARQPMPADYRGRPAVALNSHWAVGDDGALQWFLLRRAGRNWHPRRFHIERGALLRSIRELCGRVDMAVVETIRTWTALYRADAAATRGRDDG